MSISQKRPSAPKDLPPESAALWRNICAGLPANHFTAGDLVLLRALVLADYEKGRCDALVLTNGPILPDGSVNQAAKLSNQYAGTLAALSSKLRLCLSSRVRAESSGLRKALYGASFKDDTLAHFFTGDRPCQ